MAFALRRGKHGRVEEQEERQDNNVPRKERVIE